MRISFASGLSHYDPLPPGQPFCPSIDHPDASVTLHVPVDSSHSDPVEALAAIEHKGGTAYWARVTLNDVTLAYLPDHAVTGAPTERCESAESLAVGIDVLLHDGQFLATEIDMATGYGHATIDAAIGLRRPMWCRRTRAHPPRPRTHRRPTSRAGCSVHPHATGSPGAIRTPRPDDPRRSGRHSNGTQTCITRRGNPEDTMNRNTPPQDSPPHASLMQHRAAPIGPTPVPVKGFDNGEGLDNGNV